MTRTTRRKRDLLPANAGAMLPLLMVVSVQGLAVWKSLILTSSCRFHTSSEGEDDEEGDEEEDEEEDAEGGEEFAEGDEDGAWHCGRATVWPRPTSLPLPSISRRRGRRRGARCRPSATEEEEVRLCAPSLAPLTEASVFSPGSPLWEALRLKQQKEPCPEGSALSQLLPWFAAPTAAVLTVLVKPQGSQETQNA